LPVILLKEKSNIEEKMDQRINSFVTDQYTISRAQSAFLSTVYAWMVGGLLCSGLTAWFTFTSGLVEVIVGNFIIFIVLMVAEVALVFGIGSRINKMSKATAGSLFILYSFLNGLTLSSIFLIFSLPSIQQVFYISAAMFAGMSLFGYVTKKDLSGVGRFMMMGLIGVVIAMFAQMIFGGGGAFGFAISIIGVIVFAGLTAYDTQKLKNFYSIQVQNGEATGNIAVYGALMLYLDFINLFLFLLRIFGSRD
jgi:FtsH-binding integral membrane protein